MAQGWKPGETFFSPMGASVGAVFPSPGAATPPSAVAAGTPSKLAAQELYSRWFQMADTGAAGVAAGAAAYQAPTPSCG